jgi:putative oxidoreductase
MKSLFSTSATWWQLPLRLALFLVFWMHGAQKVLGLYGGPGLGGFVGWMGSAGVPVPLAYLAAFAEFLGCFGMAFGFLTRIAAFGLVSNMTVAVLMVHWKNGFFADKGGYEYPLSLLCAALALLIGGGGNLSVDRMISAKRGSSSQGPVA